MQKIADLHNFIINLNLVAAEQVDSFVDDLVITPALRGTGVAGQLIIAEKDYTAMFYIERYPHGGISEDALLAQISAWVIQNDTERTASIAFPLIVDIHDNNTADLEFGISFNELIIATADVNGTIDVDGTKYALI